MKKPHIKYWNKIWWCSGHGLNSAGNTPLESYTRWIAFCARMRVENTFIERIMGKDNFGAPKASRSTCIDR